MLTASPLSPEAITATIRSVVERQVATTRSGKALTAHDAALVANLVGNIVGNLSVVVAGMIDEAREAAVIGSDDVHHCATCDAPAHPTETNDDGICAGCIEAAGFLAATPAELAAPFQPPPSAADILASCDVTPKLRWAFHEAGAPWQGVHVLDVIHHVQIGERWIPAVSLIAAERDCGVWEFRALSGMPLDQDSEILLDEELKRERRGDACLYRVDEYDMARELCRLPPVARAA
jgi:hypothetical protein